MPERRVLEAQLVSYLLQQFGIETIVIFLINPMFHEMLALRASLIFEYAFKSDNLTTQIKQKRRVCYQ